MAKLVQNAIILVGALCLLSLPGAVLSHESPKFYVEGQVFCDVCRADFINRFSEPMPGAKVKLECRGEEKGNVTYGVEGETNKKGTYRLRVDGDHEDELCQVTLVKSGRPDCDQIPDEGWAKTPAADITLTSNGGFHGDVRQANPLGFTVKVALPGCAELFKEIEEANKDDQ